MNIFEALLKHEIGCVEIASILLQQEAPIEVKLGRGARAYLVFKHMSIYSFRVADHLCIL